MTEVLIRTVALDQLQVRDGGDGRILYGPIVPWRTEARVLDRGRLVTETFERGAFDGIDPTSVPLTRRHPRDGGVLPIGVGVELRDDTDAFHGAFRVSDTEEGNDILTLARDGVPLGLSVGFTEQPGGSRWVTRERVVRTRAGLDHVGVVRKGAYVGAHVAGVRHADTAHAQRSPRLAIARLRV